MCSVLTTKSESQGFADFATEGRRVPRLALFPLASFSLLGFLLAFCCLTPRVPGLDFFWVWTILVVNRKFVLFLGPPTQEARNLRIPLEEATSWMVHRGHSLPSTQPVSCLLCFSSLLWFPNQFALVSWGLETVVFCNVSFGFL